MVGLVLARSSVGLDRLRGVIRKYRVAARSAIPIITARFFSEVTMNFMSLVPSEKPIPKIGPIRGETSIAPMMTGMELTFRPTDAMTTENARIQAFGPRKETLLRIWASAVSVSRCPVMLKVSFSSDLVLLSTFIVFAFCKYNKFSILAVHSRPRCPQ